MLVTKGLILSFDWLESDPSRWMGFGWASVGVVCGCGVQRPSICLLRPDLVVIRRALLMSVWLGSARGTVDVKGCAFPSPSADGLFGDGLRVVVRGCQFLDAKAFTPEGEAVQMAQR